MKVKFISKKQREEIALTKQNQQNKTLESQHTSPTTINNSHHESNNTKSRENNQMKDQGRMKGEEERQQVNLSEYFMARDKDEDNVQGRERQRSRYGKESKFKEITSEEIEQRKKMKDRMLGLQKKERPERFNLTYRNQLLFEWNKNEDTSQNFVPLLPQEKGYHRAKDILSSDSMQTWKNKPYERMEERDWRIFREDHEIYIRGGKAPHPFRQWRQLQGINNKLVDNLLKLKFQKPKPIQMQAITIGMLHKDLMAIAPTGQGKTLAYLLPIVHFLIPLERINIHNFDKGPYALIVVPTRELAEQIDEQFQKITKGLDLKSFVAVGGHQFEMQALQLAKGYDIIIATPGRIKEFIDKHELSLERLSWCVIDQADKMVSQNLSEDLQFILQNGGQEALFEGKKLVHMFSATMIPEVQKLGRSYLSASYIYITIGEPGGGKKQIDQHVQLIDQAYKPDRLTKILKGLSGPIIVFVNSRENCDKISTMIQKRTERKVAQYHGGKNQNEREKVIANFRLKKVQILVATDLAGRGLDVKGINAVINYDAPKNISQFIHRSGRTGRAGMKGKAFTLLTSDDQAIFYDLRVFLQRNGFPVAQNLKDHPASQIRQGGVLNVARRKQIVYTN